MTDRIFIDSKLFQIKIIFYYVSVRLDGSLMKRKQLENELKKLGWWFLRHGGNHDIWTNGLGQEPIPRHNEINEKLARSILRKAKKS